MGKVRLAVPVFALLAGAVLLAACSAPEIRFRSEDFPFETVRTSRIAVGGLVAGALLPLEAEDPETGPLPDSAIAQADLWTHHLTTQLLIRAPELDLWSWAAVSDAASVELLSRIHADFARGSLLKPADLAELADALPGSRFLLLARIDRNERRLDSRDPVGQDARRTEAGLGQEVGEGEIASPDRPLHSLRRIVEVTLDLYDLETGRSLWSAAVERSRGDLLDSESANPDAAVSVAKDPAAADGIRISGGSRLTGGPTLEDVLPAACDALVADFLLLTAPADGNPGK